MAVSNDISDLFFNHDFSDAHRRDDAHGDFIGYDDAIMLEEAQAFIGTLERLGVTCPTARELVDDFYGRV